MPLSPEERARVALTVSCLDAEAVPKVAEAGQVSDGVQVMHNGVRVVEGCYYGAWMTEVIRQLRGHHEPQEELARVGEELAAANAALESSRKELVAITATRTWQLRNRLLGLLGRLG